MFLIRICRADEQNTCKIAVEEKGKRKYWEKSRGKGVLLSSDPPLAENRLGRDG